MTRTLVLLVWLLMGIVNSLDSENGDFDLNSENSVYHNQFAVHIPEGSKAADEISSKYGFVNLGQIGALDNYFLLEHRRVHKRSVSPAHDHHSTLSSDPRVSNK
ncbi:unnamed protein product [Meganyctiphanes norvegica]|uniref:Peptidase S8 pro-domain domain-containing protein n=1 Tax=Meganyctiphanes norvegica TaxID=48144 RepID=A0AAV2R7U3_MEGNR